VPGPGLPRPAPKKVATVQAQKVFCGWMNWQVGPSGQPPLAAAAGGLMASGGYFSGPRSFPHVRAFEVFEQIGVEDGRADLVDAHGPFAEVDAAAAVAAEGEVFVGGLDQLLPQVGQV
jgi:hypothetical protein